MYTLYIYIIYIYIYILPPNCCFVADVGFRLYFLHDPIHLGLFLFSELISVRPPIVPTYSIYIQYIYKVSTIYMV